MSNTQLISQDLLNQFQMIHDFFRKNYPKMTEEVEILARLSKIGEELGELTNEVHDKLGFHKLSAHKHSNPENLPKEWADLFNTVMLMGLVLELNMNEVISSRMKHIFERYGLIQENNLETILDWTNHPTGKIEKGIFCSHCGRFNARNMTVTVIGLNSENQVLLIKRKRNPAAGWWAMPGGYVDWNETLIQTAAREYKEETNLGLTDLVFFGLYDDLNRDKDGRQNVDHCYVGKVVPNTTLKIHPDEVTEAKWFSFDNLPENIAFDHRDMINDYLKGKNEDNN